MASRTLKRPWRLIVSPAAQGSQNMALDEALAESVRQGGLPFLRFYTWSPATLSLGRFQHPQAGLTEDSRQVPRVRRMTGGGGIWHAAELTYSLGCRQDDLLVVGVKPSFELLCGFLWDAWKALGWQVQFAKDVKQEDLGAFSPACFAGTEAYDLLVEGRKLGGNAQRRDRETIFQHGSIPLELDHGDLDRIFLPEFRPDPTQVTDLRNCGWTGSAEELIPLLTSHFQRRLGVEWEGLLPTDEEQRAAQRWEAEYFAAEEWTERGGGSLRAQPGPARPPGQ